MANRQWQTAKEWGVTTIDTPDYKQSWGGTLTRPAGKAERGARNYEETTDKRLLLAGD